MKEQNKKSKKKILLYYLILAACLLVIAAVTVTLIFTVGKRNDNVLDNNPGINNPDDGNKPGGDDNNPGGDDNKPDDKPTGGEVCAVLAGTVTKVVTDHILGENYVTITHANNMTTTYKYITAKEGLKEGDTVKRGDVIGTIAAASGMEMKQGEHLHFEITVNGKLADPNIYLDIIEK